MDALIELRSFDLLRFFIGAVIACLLAIPSYYAKSLTFTGAAAMIAVGIIVFGLGGFIPGLPIVFFFISSSLLTRVKRPAKVEAMKMSEKTGARDHSQVIANGLTATVCVVLFMISGWVGWYLAYFASICEACADTWATEIGTLSKRSPLSILTFRQVERGQSGGVTITGTLAAAIGSLATAFSAYIAVRIAGLVWMDAGKLLMLSAIAGFLGCLADSVMGASIQVQYRCSETGKLTEKSASNGRSNRLIKGFRLIDNNVVNFLGTLIAALIAMLFLYLFL